MTRMDRHIGWAFLKVFTSISLTFILLFVSVLVFEKLGGFMRFEAAMSDAALYVGARIPWMLTQSLPISCLIAALAVTVLMSRHSEITALRACGVSLFRISRPFVYCCIALTGLTFFLQESIVPVTEDLADRIETVKIKGKPGTLLVSDSNLWIRAEHGTMIHARKMNADIGRMEGVTVMELDGARVVRTTRAKEAKWNGSAWVLGEASVLTFLEGGGWNTEEVPSAAFPSPIAPDELTITKLQPSQSSMAELGRRIKLYRSQGIDSTQLEVEFWRKSSYPVACLLMPLLAIPFAVRSTARRGMWRSVGASFAIGFIYLVLLIIGASIGSTSSVPVWLGAWAPNVVFAVIAIVLYRRAEHGV